MPYQTRYAGDANGVNNFDATVNGALGTIVATGLTKSPTALKLTGMGNFVAGESATGGAVESILRSIAIDSTIVMYQVDSTQISVLLEATGSNAATINTRVQALTGTTGTGNISVAGGSNVWANTSTTASTYGFKIATS